VRPRSAVGSLTERPVDLPASAGTGRDELVESRASWPAIVCSTTAASPTVFVIGPT
jgi:hypothetical protein